METIKERVVAHYKKAFKTNNEPDIWDITNLCRIFVRAAECCSDAEEKVGKDILDIFKRCTKARKYDIEVNITQLADEIGWYK